MAAIADELFDDIVPRGEGDFVELFALPFPAIAIGELLGVRPEDRDDFRRWSLVAVSGADRRGRRGLRGGQERRSRTASRSRSSSERSCSRPPTLPAGTGHARHRRARRRQQPAGHRPSRRRALPRRGASPRLPAARGGSRDDDQPDRAHAVPAARATRADGSAAHRSVPAPARHRGSAALRLPRAGAVPDECLRIHGRRRDAPTAHEGPAAVRLGQS